jgi:uncharacterized membrane protein
MFGSVKRQKRRKARLGYRFLVDGVEKTIEDFHAVLYGTMREDAELDVSVINANIEKLLRERQLIVGFDHFDDRLMKSVRLIKVFRIE